MAELKNPILVCPDCRKKLPNQKKEEKQYCQHCGKMVKPKRVEGNVYEILKKKLKP